VEGSVLSAQVECVRLWNEMVGSGRKFSEVGSL
jgi:hypothetical protein